jgi:methyl-accepting chemotaxis protein
MTQLGLVTQLQQRANEAIARNDWQNVDKLTTTIDKAFGTFLQGVQIMAIDVSALKNVLSGAGAVSPDVIKQLTEKVDAQAKDLAEIKTALEELNAAAGSAPVPPVV